MSVGVVVEGETDWIVLKELFRALWPGSKPELLHPKQDELDAGVNVGWSAVKRWLRKKGRHLRALVQFGGYACVVLHLDGDVAPAKARPCQPDATAQWEALSRTALRWARLDDWPETVVLAFPLQKLEAWICAALDGCKVKHPGLECVDPVPQMPERYRQSAQQREGETYQDVFAPAVVRNWRNRVLVYCPVGAGRFDQALRCRQVDEED